MSENYIVVPVKRVFFVPLDLTKLYDDALKEFGIILAEQLKVVKGNDKLPKDVVNEIKLAVKKTLDEEIDTTELAKKVSDELLRAGVPNAVKIAESTVGEWVERLKKLLKREEKKALEGEEE